MIYILRSPDYYRERAAECYAILEDMKNLAHKIAMLRVVLDYEDLAIRAKPTAEKA